MMIHDKSEKIEHEISKWRIVDILAIIILLIFSFFYALYPIYQILMLAAISVLLLIIFLRPLYYKDVEHSSRFKKAASIIRTFGYTVIVAAVIITFTMRQDWKWYYPVQKMIYTPDKKTEQFLPDKIPKNAENYKAFFCRFPFPGATRIEISFFTDSETLDEYRKKAIRNGASDNNENAGRTRWYSEMEEQGVPYEQAEYYFYPGGSEHFPKVYILEESTGYVKIYY